MNERLAEIEGERTILELMRQKKLDKIDLKESTETVKNYTFQSKKINDNDRNPLPPKPGIRKSPIKHIVYITKENRTYDEVYGQLADYLLAVIYDKIEQDSESNRPITKAQYLECHIKVLDGEDCELKGFQRSRNPRDRLNGKDIYFWNKRWYSGTLKEAQAEVDCGLAFVFKDILEVKFEHVLIDSRHELDSWWA